MNLIPPVEIIQIILVLIDLLLALITLIIVFRNVRRITHIEQRFVQYLEFLDKQNEGLQQAFALIKSRARKKIRIINKVNPKNISERKKRKIK